MIKQYLKHNRDQLLQMKVKVYTYNIEGDTQHPKFLLSYHMKINTEFSLATYVLTMTKLTDLYICKFQYL